METTTPKADSGDPLVGELVGKFRIVERLGAGGMGVVYRAEDTSIGRIVALKTLTAERMADPMRKRRLIREARSLGTLSHPSIATIYEVGEADGIDYIAMELIEGETLKSRLSRGALPAAEAVPLFIAVADALAHAHGEGVVHRDLKPSNVMVARDRKPKLLDFGIAKLLDAGGSKTDSAPTTHEGQILGTPSFMSPEQALGDRVDHRSDIFSFGALMYAAVSGRPPFEGETPHETVVAVYRTTPLHLAEVAPELPSALRNLIHRCLRKDPEKRYQRSDAIRMDLELLGSNATATAVGTSGGASDVIRETAPERHVVSLILVFGVLAIAALLLGASWWWRASSATNEGTLDAAIRSVEPAEIRLTTAGVATTPVDATLSHDGRLFAYATLNGIWVTEFGTSSTRRVETPPLTGALGVSLLPDNSRAVVSGVGEGGAGELWIVSLNGGAPVRVYSGRAAFLPEVSPSGDECLFSTKHGLQVLSLDRPHTISTIIRTSDIVVGRWSPSGNELVYTVVSVSHATQDGRGEIWVANRDGSAKRRIIERTKLVSSAGVSPAVWVGRSSLAFAVHGRATELWTIGSSPGAVATKVHEWSHTDLRVVDGRDGQLLLLKSNSQGEIAVGHVGNSTNASFEVERLDNRSSGDMVQTWMHDGRLAYTETTSSGYRLMAVDLATQEVSAIASDVMQLNRAGSVAGGVYFWREPDAGTLALLYRDLAQEAERVVWEISSEAAPRVACTPSPRSYCVVSELHDGRLTFREVTAAGGVSSEILRQHESFGDSDWALSPDGQRIAYSLIDGRAGVLDLSTGQVRELTVLEDANMQAVAWSSSNRLIFTAAWIPGEAFGGILSAGPDGGGEVMWRSDTATVMSPTVSPDGRLAFSIFTISADLWMLEGVPQAE
jgi:WD40 repeat protein/predicted Ser/Thr protein kinase